MKSGTVTHTRTTSVRKWGNGHGVLLPKAFVDTLDLAQSQVEAEVRGTSIVLTKTKTSAPKKKKLTLEDMVRGMRKKDRHELVDFGEPRGKEIW